MPDRRDPAEADRWDEIRELREADRAFGRDALDADEVGHYPHEIAEAVAGLDRLLDRSTDGPIYLRIRATQSSRSTRSPDRTTRLREGSEGAVSSGGS